MSLTGRVQRLIGTRDDGRTYRCRACGTGYDLNRQVCPCCGSYLIERASYEDLIPGD